MDIFRYVVYNTQVCFSLIYLPRWVKTCEIKESQSLRRQKSKNAVYDYSGRHLYNAMSFTINEKRYSVTLFPTLNKKDNVFIGFSSKLRSSTAF